MNWLDFSMFLFEKIKETIDCGQYIKEVSIDYELGESFGNEYIRVNYNVTANNFFYDLPFSMQQTMFNGETTLYCPVINAFRIKAGR